MSSTWAENRTHISQLWGTGKKVQKENWLKLWALAEGFLWAGLWGLWRAELCSHPEAFAIVSLTLELLWSQEVWPVYLNQRGIFEIAGKPQVPAHRARISVVTFKIAHPKTILKWYLLSTDHLLGPLFLTLPVYNAAGRRVWVLCQNGRGILLHLSSIVCWSLFHHLGSYSYHILFIHHLQNCLLSSEQLNNANSFKAEWLEQVLVEHLHNVNIALILQISFVHSFFVSIWQHDII